MELRHLRYFIAVAEELHFARAAERLHIEQSPLSRAIKDLEYDLGAQLFERTTRSTRLTWAGQVFLEEAHRVLTAVNQATASVKSATSGYHGRLRIALSDGIAQPRLSALLFQCREEEPDVEIRIFEMPFSEQVKGLRNDLLDAGFALISDAGNDLVAEPTWTDAIMLAIPARHPLLTHKRVALHDAVQYPLILSLPEFYTGHHRQIEALLRTMDIQPIVADRVASLEVMLTLVGAGYGIAFAMASQVAIFHRPDIGVRPLVNPSAVFTTFLVRPKIEPSGPLTRFIERASRSGAHSCKTAAVQ